MGTPLTMTCGSMVTWLESHIAVTSRSRHLGGAHARAGGGARQPLAHEGHESLRPLVACAMAQVGVRRQQVVHHHAVVAAVDAVTALHLVRKLHAGCQVLEAGVMEFMAQAHGPGACS